MSKPILPDHLTEKISTMINAGLSTIDIYDEIIEEASPHEESEDQVTGCISSIRSKATLKNKNIKNYPEKKLTIPAGKNFDTNPHSDNIKQLNTVMSENKFKSLCDPVVMDILQNYEQFKLVESANNVSGFHNPPFDFIAFKGKTPYLIAFKGSLNSFNSPGETQKRRLKELMSHFEGLKLALIQVRINTGEYRIFYNNEINLFFDGRKISIAPVVHWIDGKLNKSDCRCLT
jgi:hypothetical protein